MTFLENTYRGRKVFVPKNTQNIWIIDNESIAPFSSIWQHSIKEYLESLGYVCKFLTPSIVKIKNRGFQNEILYRSKQLEEFYYASLKSEIQNGDVFIFLNIWNPLLILLQRHKKINRHNSISIVGFWDDNFLSDFTKDDKKRTSINYKRDEWATFLNFGFFKLCDIVIFRNVEQRESLNFSKAMKKKYWNQLKNYYGYPLSLAKPTRDFQKENLILIPYEPETDRAEMLIQNLISDFPMCEVVVMRNKNAWSREDYLDLLSRAKITVNFNVGLTNPEDFYEHLLYEVYPFTHNKIVNQNALNDIFKYPVDLLLPSMINLIRNQFKLWEVIEDVVQNYETKYLDKIKENAKILTDGEYKSEDFINIMKYLKYEQPGK